MVVWILFLCTNSFHSQIEFTNEKEIDLKIILLRILLIRKSPNLSTKVYRKPTNTDSFVHWNPFAPIQLKRYAFNMLISHIYTISSNTDDLNTGLKYIRQTFNKVDGYPYLLVTKVTSGYQKKNRKGHLVNQGNELHQSPKKHTFLLPY